jgi:uncharacterized protein YbjT (DUF2867 family)
MAGNNELFAALFIRNRSVSIMRHPINMKEHTMQPRILITGATGNTGSEVVRQLLAAGQAVRVLAHSAESAKKLAAGVETAVAEYDDSAGLDRAFAGVEAVYALTPVHQKQVEWMRRLIDTAKRAGVQRFVKLSGMTAGPDSPSALIRDHHATDEYLRRSGQRYTIVQPNSFMQNLLWSAASIKQQGAFYQPTGDARQSVVDIADVAAVVVKALTEPGHEGKTYVLTGPESLTYHDMAAKIAAAIGKPVNYVAVPPAAAEQSMLESGMPAWLAHTLVEFFSAVATGAYANVSGDVKKVLGREPAAFSDFLQRHLAAFK